ncbi:MAG: ribonuclease H-like domain-containing protein [Myxococcaceae bacterium]
MLTRTFQLVPGIGPWREKDLWARGIGTWNDFLDQRDIVVSSKVDIRARERLAAAQTAFSANDLASLARMIPQREHWRLYSPFAAQTVFFDIETDGTVEQNPTVVSLMTQGGLRVFREGVNLQALPEALATSPIWVTFNGRCFDVPVLRQHFSSLQAPLVHIDLRFLCQRVGLAGGLKEIENRLGIGRPTHLRGTNGQDAVTDWHAYATQGDRAALRRLVEYNLYDTLQLRTVLEKSCNRAAEALGWPAEFSKPFERGDVLFDVSRLVLAAA